MYHPLSSKWLLYPGEHLTTGKSIPSQKASPIFNQRYYASLVSLQNNLLVVIGGYQTSIRKATDEVYTYKVREDAWSNQAPALNQARFAHSSLYLGNAVYVCGG